MKRMTWLAGLALMAPALAVFVNKHVVWNNLSRFR